MKGAINIVERIGSADTMQSMAIRSAKPSEDAKAQDTSAKEQSVAQTGESRNRDRFESSSEASRYGSPDDAAARAAFDKAHSTAQESNPRRYDRFEIDMSAVELNEVQRDEKSDSGKEIASPSQNSLSDDSSESVDTTKLYRYADNELKNFLLDGSITQREYNAEIEKREY